MVVAAHQLHYLPWLRYFDKIHRCDAFVVLDDAQFNVNGWQNRNRIKGPDGPLTLTVPIRHQFPQRLDEVLVAGPSSWRRKHWVSIEQHYRRAPWFERVAANLGAFYAQTWERLNDINYAMLTYFLDVLGITTPIVRSSTLGVDGAASERLVRICRKLGANEYLTGEHATHVYLDPECFERSGIRLRTARWQCPTYAQRYGAFVPDLSIIDLLCNEGPRALARLTGEAA